MCSFRKPIGVMDVVLAHWRTRSTGRGRAIAGDSSSAAGSRTAALASPRGIRRYAGILAKPRFRTSPSSCARSAIPSVRPRSDMVKRFSTEPLARAKPRPRDRSPHHSNLSHACVRVADSSHSHILSGRAHHARRRQKADPHTKIRPRMVPPVHEPRPACRWLRARRRVRANRPGRVSGAKRTV